MRNKLYFPLMIIASLFLISACSAPQPVEKTYELSQSIWKSVDNGKTWEPKNAASEKPPTADLDVLSMLINPYDTQTIYVGLVSGGMMKTVDGGNTWQFTNFVTDKVYGLDMDPFDARIIYASSVWNGRGKIWKTEDGGENWKEIYTEPAEGPLVIALLVDHINPKNIYVSTSENQIIKSEDSGNTWKKITQTSSPVTKIAMDRRNNKAVYFLTSDGQVILTNDGINFSQLASFPGLTKPVSTSDFSVVLADPNQTGGVYLAGSGGIIRSRDFGATWETVNELNDPDNYPITALAVNPSNPSEIIYVASQALYKSVDGGAHWSTYQFDTSRRVTIIKYDPKNPAVVYLGFRK